MANPGVAGVAGTALKSFGSDNHSGVHPKILEALARVNSGSAVAYGNDPVTAAAAARVREALGGSAEVFFSFNGTGANVSALHAVLKPYEAVIVTEHAHLHTDECGAFERHAGSKLVIAASVAGKMTVQGLKAACKGRGDEHHVQARAVSLTQTTELGTAYSIAEMRALIEMAHSQGLLAHVDGARISNAAVSLGVSLKEITADLGVDLMTFGGTKNGLLGAEAVVFFRPELAETFKYYRKQGMQLASKMRFLAAQFDALLTNDLWAQNARHANAMAQQLAAGVRTISGVEIAYPTQANAVFARLPRAAIEKLQQEYVFYVWADDPTDPSPAGRPLVRWMTSFNTTPAQVEDFVASIGGAIGAGPVVMR